MILKKTHPLWHLRRYGAFRSIQRFFNFSIYARLYKVDWKVKVRLMRHISWILNSRSYEPGIRSMFLAIDTVIRPEVFWDIGANIGFYGWLLKSRNKNLRIIFFEPDPDNISLLQDTALYTGLQDIYIIPHAVSDEEGKALFIIDDVSSATGALKEQHERPMHNWYGLSKTINVETVTLDSLRHNHTPPDLLKIDTEGAEKRIFDGGKALIKEKQPIIIFESTSSEKREIISFLKKLNYNVYNAENIDGVIDSAYNILALPLRHHHASETLFNAWRGE